MAALVNRRISHSRVHLHGDFRCSLDDSFPKESVDVADPQEERANARLIRFLETRVQERDLLQEDVHEKRKNNPQDTFQHFNYGCTYSNFNVVFSENHFRNILVELERENTSLKYNNNEQQQTVRLHIL